MLKYPECPPVGVENQMIDHWYVHKTPGLHKFLRQGYVLFGERRIARRMIVRDDRYLFHILRLKIQVSLTRSLR